MAQHIMHYPLGLLLLFEYISKFWSPVISNYSSNYSHDKSPHIYQKCENVVLYVLTHSQVMRAACKSASRLQCDQSSWAAVVWQTTNSCSITSVTHSTTNKNSTSLTIYSLRQKRRPYHCITLDTHGWFCSPTPNKQYTMVKVQNNSTKQVLYIFIYVGTEIAKKDARDPEKHSYPVYLFWRTIVSSMRMKAKSCWEVDLPCGRYRSHPEESVSEISGKLECHSRIRGGNRRGLTNIWFKVKRHGSGGSQQEREWEGWKRKRKHHWIWMGGNCV